MKKNKMGRPLLDATPKDTVLAARIGKELAASQASQAKGATQTQSEWLRTAIEIQVKGPPIWVKSKWQKQELDDQLIRFELHSPTHIKEREMTLPAIRELSGIGKLAVRENANGEIAVDIFIHEYPGPHEGIVTRIWLAQNAVDAIELNIGQDADKIKFTLRG